MQLARRGGRPRSQRLWRLGGTLVCATSTASPCATCWMRVCNATSRVRAQVGWLASHFKQNPARTPRLFCPLQPSQTRRLIAVRRPRCACIPPCLPTLPTPSELAELQDPAGAAQAAVAELSARVPDKAGDLRQFLDTKVAGVRSVLDAMLWMRALATSAVAPRTQRSVVVLVITWLLLILGVSALLWCS